METLENEFLRIQVRNKGAELISLFDKSTQTEHLWQGDPDIWEWHAPNLFPVVGACQNNRIIIKGTKYEMPRHGFARNSEFSLIEKTETTAKFSLIHNADTRSSYPYKFAFHIIYDLHDQHLRISYKVINYEDDTIYFSVGGHPAFNVPFYENESSEDYYLEFEKEEPLVSYLLSKDGFFNGKTQLLEQVKNTLPIKQDMFIKDALVFKNLESKKVCIKSHKNKKQISLEYPHFNYLGIWSKNNAPFICLEPWIGCADSEGAAVDISKKEGIHSLDQGHVFEVSFNIVLS